MRQEQKESIDARLEAIKKLTIYISFVDEIKMNLIRSSAPEHYPVLCAFYASFFNIPGSLIELRTMGNELGGKTGVVSIYEKTFDLCSLLWRFFFMSMPPVVST